nr:MULTISPECIES: DegT/DnrJ/EryC1/StrS family aminotransferase [unclassified Escherichia]
MILKKRSELISYLKENKIHSVFHYLSLNKSEYYIKQNEKVNLKNSDKFSDCLLRLPMYYELESKQVNYISEKITEFFKKNA